MLVKFFAPLFFKKAGGWHAPQALKWICYIFVLLYDIVYTTQAIAPEKQPRVVFL